MGRDELFWALILEVVATVLVGLLAWTMGGISALSGLGEAKYSRTGAMPSSRKSLIAFILVVFFLLLLIIITLFAATEAPVAQAQNTSVPIPPVAYPYPTVTPIKPKSIPPSPTRGQTVTPSPTATSPRPSATATTAPVAIPPSLVPTPTKVKSPEAIPLPSPTAAPACAGVSMFISMPFPGVDLSQGNDMRVEGVVCGDHQSYVSYTVEIHQGHSLSESDRFGWSTLEDRFKLQRENDFTIANPTDLVPGEKPTRNGCNKVSEVLLQSSRIAYEPGPYTLRLKAFEGTWQGNKYTKNGQFHILSSRCWVEFTIIR